MNKHILTKSQTSQPVLVQLSNKTGKPTTIFRMPTINNTLVQVGKPYRTSLKPTTSEYWDTYFNGLNLLHDPRVITGGILGAEIANDVFNDSSPMPNTFWGGIISVIKNANESIDKK